MRMIYFGKSSGGGNSEMGLIVRQGKLFWLSDWLVLECSRNEFLKDKNLTLTDFCGK